jgi:glycogen synthase
VKILLSSYLFHPSVGGIESVSRILAEKFSDTGNEVHVITQSPGDPFVGAKYSVTRRPSLRKLLSLLRSCDLFFQNNISLRSLIPALLLRKPSLVVHQTWLQDIRGRITWHSRIKRALLSRVTNVAISKAVADSISGHSFVIGNAYDDAIFRVLPIIERDRQLIFVGRLVSDKGVDLLLRALEILKRDGLLANLTIVGSGPEENYLRSLNAELGLDRQVAFVGPKSGAELAELLNRHRILIVPSHWAEPFGVVALEGIACGCIVVGSENGGLKEAIGPCGVTFENGNVSALANELKLLLNDGEAQIKLRQQASEHVSKFRSDAIAAAYLRLMRKMIA